MLRHGPRDGSAEIERIRKTFESRDRRPRMSSWWLDAYARTNADRFERMRQLIQTIVTDPGPRLLDVGCGAGYDLKAWAAAGWPADRLAGVDLVADRVAAARRAVPGADLRLVSDERLPFDDGVFNITTAVTVLSSILDVDLQRAVFDEMRRVTRRDGAVVVYDFVVANPHNPAVVALPHRRLVTLGGPPAGSIRLTPLIHLVAAGAFVHPYLAAIAMRIGPRTHRLTWWRP